MTSSTPHDRKCYGQACPMATALDVVGDRWTLLILRELLGGPARFNELQAGLQGIAKNLLTSRLRRLESDGIVRRIKPQAAVLYALTERGAAIRPALEQLGFWGASLDRVGPVEHQRSIRAIAMALQAILVRAGDALPDQRMTVELQIGGATVEIGLGPHPTASARLSTCTDARVRVPAETVDDFLLGQPFHKNDFAHISGDESATRGLLEALGALP